MYPDVRSETGQLHEWLLRVIRRRSAGPSGLRRGFCATSFVDHMFDMFETRSGRHAMMHAQSPRKRSAWCSRNPRPSASCKLYHLHQQQTGTRR